MSQKFDIDELISPLKGISITLLVLEVLFWSFTGFLVYKKYKKRRILK